MKAPHTMVGSTPPRHVVVVGAGGNIGSQAVPLLARVPSVGRLTLIDRDVYEEANLLTQNITRADVGRAKAEVQARSARRIRPALRVAAVAADVEHLPLGTLRADLIVACLDSRRARQHVNECARRLGLPWIDSGVGGAGLLARVSAYGGDEGQACLECGWDDRDYEVLEVTYPCRPGRGSTPATDAAASLGALAASLLVIECEKVLTQSLACPGGEVLVDARHQRLLRSYVRRNGHCRLTPHGGWEIEPLAEGPGQLTVAELVERAAPRCGPAEACAISSFRRVLACATVCPGCGRRRPVLRFEDSLARRPERCSHCRREMVPDGLGLVERARLRELDGRHVSSTWRAVGARPGDVLTVSGPEGEVHFELGSPAASRRPAPSQGPTREPERVGQTHSAALIGGH